jgi:hypothetical protein
VNYPTPPKQDQENCYRIDILGNRFRSLRIIKSNDSDTGMRIPLRFNGISEIFEELPLPKTPEIKRIYQELTKNSNSKYTPIVNPINFGDTEEVEENPF